MEHVYTYSFEKNGLRFRADMAEGVWACIEQVHVFDVATGAGLGLIHSATFDRRNLGDADRNQYVHVMCHSVADRYLRKV